MPKPSKIDELENVALDIATEHFLRRTKLRALGSRYGIGASTIHRFLEKCIEDGRFELVDKKDKKTTAYIVDRDGSEDRLEEELIHKTKIWHARVATISGADAAYSESYLSEDSREIQIADGAADNLHKALGKAAADYMSNRLRRNMTIGLGSGRGVGFTINFLGELAKKKPAMVAGNESIRIISLCGGGHVGTWAVPTTRSLDADENVFHLAAILNVKRRDVTYASGWISEDYQPKEPIDSPHNIDLALIGLGELNTRQYFYRYFSEVHLQEVVEHLKMIYKWQWENPARLHRIADITHRLFPIAPKDDLPPQILEAIDKINNAIVTVPPQTLRKAPEVIMTAGGAQKLNGLFQLITGGCLDAPIDIRNLTLITDKWTAERIVKMANNLSKPSKR